MLQDIRNSTQGTAAKVVVGLIVVTFALFGVESIVGGLSGEPEVATVNGVEIPESSFARALEGKRRQILAQMGDQADPDLIDESLLRTSVLEGMIEEEILAQDAEEKGLVVAEAAIDSYIRSIPQFQEDGAFSNERMQAILRNAGLTLQAYRDSLRKQFVLNQPRSGLIASAFVLDQERDELIALDRQARTFGVATVFKSDYMDAISVSDADVEAYYEANKLDFKKPENVDVAYVQISKTALQKDVSVSDDEVLTLYESEKATFNTDEERRASHILIKTDGERSEEEALALIKAAQDRLASGEEFAEVAQELSEDEGSAADGGDLGMSGRGVYVADFEDALFTLQEGEVSEPVKTEFGYHLIKLTEVDANKVPEFEDMKVQLSARLKSEKADAIYADRTEQLADISYASSDLAEPADELGLEIKELFGVSAQSSDPVFSNVRVQRVLFSEELREEGLNSDVIEIDDDKAIVFRVNAYHEASVQPLAAVRAQVRQKIVESKAAEYAESVGQAFIARVNSGEKPQLVSDDMGLNWKVHEDVKRNNVMVSREIVTKAFAMKQQEESNPISGFEVMNGDFAIVMLEDVVDGDPSSLSAEEKTAIRDMIGDNFGAGDYRNYQDVMIRDAEVEKI